MSDFRPETMPALERMRKAAAAGQMPSLFELMEALCEVSDNAYEPSQHSQADAGCQKCYIFDPIPHP